MVVFDPRAKGKARGQVRQESVLNLDLPSTFLSWAGVDIPKRYQGRTFDALVSEKSGLGTAGVVVINKDQDIIKCMARIARFYKHESCGQCTPCREGSGWMWRMLERMARGEASRDEIEMLGDVTKQIEGHTICAFGEGSSWPVQGLLRHFKDEIKKRNKFDPIVEENKNIPYLVDQHLLDKNA